MLACHASQGVEVHYKMGEAIRQADLAELEDEIHEYSLYPWQRIHPLMDRFVTFLGNSTYYKESMIKDNMPDNDILGPIIEQSRQNT